jgi:hypothetical protein
MLFGASGLMDDATKDILDGIVIKWAGVALAGTTDHFQFAGGVADRQSRSAFKAK